MPTLNELNNVLTRAGRRAIDRPMLDAILAHTGPDKLGQIVSEACNGDNSAEQALMRYATAADLQASLAQFGHNIVLAQANAILMCHDIGDIRSAVTQANNGDANARATVGQWVVDLGPTDQGSIPVRAEPTQTQGDTPPISAVNPRVGSGASSRQGGQVEVTQQARSTKPVMQVVRSSAPEPQDNNTRQGGGYTVANGNASHCEQHQQAHTPSQVPRQTPSNDPRTLSQPPHVFDDAKAYGARAALTLCADETRSGNPTVCIESAVVLDQQARTYDWQNKLRFQLTTHELQLVTGLLLGQMPDVHLSNHGDKWMTITRQDNDPKYGGTIKVTMGQGKAKEFQPRTVQIDSSAIGKILSLCIRQSRALLKCHDTTDLLHILRQITCLYIDRQNARNNQGGMRRRAG